jgi:hypothetical protein
VSIILTVSTWFVTELHAGYSYSWCHLRQMAVFLHNNLSLWSNQEVPMLRSALQRHAFRNALLSTRGPR